MAKKSAELLASRDMTLEELKQRLDAGDDLFVLDVREPTNTRSATSADT